jgi:hypothetical protein
MEVFGFELGAGVRVATYCAVEPLFTDAGPVTTRVKVLVMRAVAVPDFAGSATLRAVTVIVSGMGRTCGAVKFPAASMLPQSAPVQPTPETLQFT